MSSKNGSLEVTIRYKGLDQTISGTPDDVTKAYFEVISKLIPNFDVISGLIEKPNLINIANNLKGIVSLYKDRVIVLRDDIETQDAILLALSGKYLSYRINLANKDTMGVSDIIDATGKTRKNVMFVLHKLANTNSIEKVTESQFRISESKMLQYMSKRISSLRIRRMTDFTKKYNTIIANHDYDAIGFTIGYEGRRIDELVNILKENGIQTLVDVRRDAYSKYNDSFNEGVLSEKLTESKIRYLHLPELGVNYVDRQKLKELHNYSDYFKNYSDYIDKNSDLISLMRDLSRYNTLCLMCFERDYRRCHRSVLADKLKDKGLMFVHI